MEGDDPEVQSLRRLAVEIGGKVTLEILAKAFSNSCIDDHVSVLGQVIQKDPANLAREFLQGWYEKDRFEYLFAVVLECLDARAR